MHCLYCRLMSPNFKITWSRKSSWSTLCSAEGPYGLSSILQIDDRKWLGQRAEWPQKLEQIPLVHDPWREVFWQIAQPGWRVAEDQRRKDSSGRAPGKGPTVLPAASCATWRGQPITNRWPRRIQARLPELWCLRGNDPWCQGLPWRRLFSRHGCSGYEYGLSASKSLQSAARQTASRNLGY